MDKRGIIMNQQFEDKMRQLKEDCIDTLGKIYNDSEGIWRNAYKGLQTEHQKTLDKIQQQENTIDALRNEVFRLQDKIRELEKE